MFVAGDDPGVQIRAAVDGFLLAKLGEGGVGIFVVAGAKGVEEGHVGRMVANDHSGGVAHLGQNVACKLPNLSPGEVLGQGI